MPGWKKRSEMRILGKDTPRLDGPIKATGRAKYAYDINLPGLLQSRILRSPHANAIIESIDVIAARSMPGVKAVIITANAGDEMKFAGQEVGAVAATTMERAEDAIRAIKVKYRVQPHVVWPELAMKPGAPKVHNDGNVPKPNKRETGDVDAAFSKAKFTSKGTYTVAVRTHASLETHGVTCRWDDDTHLTCWASTQGVFSVRDELAGTFKLKPEDVHVITEVMGGGFGSKFGAGYEGVMCARLAKEAKAPVKLLLTREEEQLAVGNAPSASATYTLAANEEGKIIACDVKGYSCGGIARENFPMPFIYDVGAVRSEQGVVFTNTGGSRAWRAPGHTQASFLMEAAMDDLATEMGIDPLELRLKNDKHPLRQAQFKEGARLIGWERRNPKPGLGALAGAGRFRRGLGCGGAIWYPGGQGGSQCKVTINRQGEALVEIGVQDIGTGTRTICAMIVAEELGIPLSKVKTNIGKSTLGYGVASGGSVTTPSTAPAVKRAAESAKAALLALAAPKIGANTDELDADDGKVFVKSDRSKSMSFADACKLAPTGGIVGNGRFEGTPQRPDPLQQAGVAGAQFAEVEVDTETGRVNVIKVVALQDAGIILNPLTFTSQVNGAVIQGIGMALYEDRHMCQLTGRMVNANLEEYKLPGPMEMPEFVSIPFENPTATGVTGVGEPPVIPTAAAIRNAVLNASGARVNEAPMTPALILGALAEARRRANA